MAKELWTAVSDYLDDLFVPQDEIMQGILKASDAAGLPAISVSPSEGKLLMLLATIRGAHRILEIGTLGGYSTVWLARGLAKDGILITLEVNEDHAKVARANIAFAGLAQQVEVRLGPATESLAHLVAEACDPFDLIFIDANKEDYPEYLAWTLKLSEVGTVIIADNVVREGGILDASSSDPRIQGTRRFNELLAAESRVAATVLQTVGRKGYDGIAIATVISKL